MLTAIKRINFSFSDLRFYLTLLILQILVKTILVHKFDVQNKEMVEIFCCCFENLNFIQRFTKIIDFNNFYQIFCEI